MTQKIIRVGNSAAVSIPREYLKAANLKIGDTVNVQTDPDLKIMLIRSENAPSHGSLTPEFKSWLDEFMSQHKESLETLANI